MGPCMANARRRARRIAVCRRCLVPFSAVPRARRPALSGHDSAAVEYWAVSTARDGTVETIAGVALLRFGADCRVVAERDYWNLAEGRVEPYEGWGRLRP